MKYIKILIVTFFIMSFVLISCNKSATEPEEKTIIGKWSYSSAKFKRILTTHSNQIAKLPYSGDGLITVAGSVNGVLNGLIVYGSDPVSINILNIEYDIYIVNLLSIDDNSKIGTFYAGTTEQTYQGPINYSFDGIKLIIEESTLANQVDSNDIISVSGEISFETINITANNPVAIEVPAVQTQYPRGFMKYEFLDDGTFIKTVNENDGWVINTGTWENSGNTITTTITENNYTDVRTIEYSIDGNILSGVELYDLCENSQDFSQCLSYYEDIFQIEYGSLAKVMMEATIYFREVNDLN